MTPSGSFRRDPVSAAGTGNVPETLSLPVLRGAETAGGESAGRELTARSLGVDGTAAVVGVDTGRLAPAPCSRTKLMIGRRDARYSKTFPE